MHNSRIKRITLAVCLALIPLAATAAGLGKLTVLSGLGEPLSAEIELLATTKAELSTMSARLAPVNVYAEHGIEMTSALSGIRVELINKSNGTPILKLTTAQPVNDPFLDMLIRVDWASGRLLREYTALLDPPGFVDQSLADTTVAPVVPGGWVSTSAEQAKSGTMPPVAEKGLPSGKGGRTSATAQQSKDQITPLSGSDAYTTRRGDTLRAIARQMPVQGVSLERLLVGLYRANHDAFVGKNMNRLKVGQILRLPAEDELQAIDQQEAQKEVRVQTADWNAYRNNLASAVAVSAPSRAEDPGQSAAGKISAPAEDRAATPVTGPRDVVKLSKSDAGPSKAGTGSESKGGGTGGQDQLAALQDEVAAREKALKEANVRATSLEKQIQDMKSLLELKNQTLAGAQKESQPQEVESSKPPVLPETVAQTAPATVASSAAPAVNPEGEKQKSRKVIKPPPVQPVQEEPGFVDNLLASPGLLAGLIGGLIAILAGAWFYLRNKRRQSLDAFEQGILTTGGLKPNTVFGDTAGGAVDTGDTSFLTDFSHTGEGGMIDTNEVDPVAEAEVYMAYGRDVQAEEILKDALVKEPRRIELYTKLLEIYANRKDTVAFETLAGELYATIGAASPAWEKIAETGRKLEPGNPLYAARSAAKPAEEPMDSAQITPAPSSAKSDVAAHDEAARSMAETSSLDFSLDAEPENAELPTIAVAPPAEQADESAHDFDIGKLDDTQPAPGSEVASEQIAEDEAALVSELDAPVSAETTSTEVVMKPVLEAVPPSETKQVETAGLDFSFELPEPAAPDNAQLDAADLGFESLPEMEEPVAPADVEPASLELPAMPDDEPEQAGGDESLASPIEKPVTSEATQTLKVPPEPKTPLVDLPLESKIALPADEESADGGLDFNFDVDLDEGDSSAQGKPEEKSPVVPDLDLSGINLDLDGGVGRAAVAAEAEKSTSPDSESTDVDTKLDLVTAYLDMGDKEGARELLQEVVHEGGPQQRERAQKLLDTLD